MRFSYRKRNETIWKEIPNVIMPIAISDVADDTFDNAKLSFLVSGDDSDFNELRYMKPKTYIRITSTDDDNDNDINERNTYYFITTKLPKARIRKEIKNELDVVTTEKLWQVEIVGMELVKELEDTNMPNYTITQPKTQFFNRYRRTLSDRYAFSGGFKFSYILPSSIALSGSSKTTINMSNSSGVISSNIISGKITTTLNNISSESFTITLKLYWQRTASGRFSWLFAPYQIDAITSLGKNVDDDTYMIIEKKYYDSGNVLQLTTTEEVDITRYFSLTDQDVDVLNGYLIKSLGEEKLHSQEIVIEKNENYDHVVVEATLYKKYQMVNRVDSVVFGGFEDGITDIDGFTNDKFLKAQINSIEIDVSSNQLSDEIIEPKQTLLNFVEKAIFDYNFNRRNKITLSDESKVLLDVFAKESEWSGYNFRELLVRAFKYVGAIPYLTIDRVITHVKPKVFDTTLVIDDLEDDDENINDEDYFDTVVSSAKNLVSDTDFATETVFIGSGSDEFSQITDNNATFTFNSSIYYISKAILFAPAISFDIPTIPDGTRVVNTNMNSANYWDITERVLDSNLYKALPNVNFSSLLGRTSSQLGQGNTISFVSGGRKVENIGNKAPDIPSFNVISNNPQISEYAIVELLLCLAYEHLMAQYGYDVNDFTSYSPSAELDKIINLQLTLTFVPYHKEITTKFISNKQDRNGLNYQKKLNISDRTIDYKESQLVLSNEMNKKGNVQKFVTKKYKTLDEVIPVGSIINDGKYVVSSKRLVLHNEMVECEYTLDSEILNQNTDIGLSVDYEAYNVPYEYVLREVFIDNHLIFSKSSTSDYNGEPMGCNITLLQDIFAENIINDLTLNKEIYANITIGYEEVGATTNNLFMNIKKLTSRFSMILGGNFIDNYSAGSQRYMVSVGGENIWYSQPYRYTDYRGRFDNLSYVFLGYNPNERYRIDDNYNLNLFPDTDGYSILRPLYNNNDSHVMLKDSREAIAINHHTYLETIDDDIKFYEFMTVNAFGSLRGDLNLTDNLQLEDIDFTYWETIPISISFTSITNGFIVKVSIPTQDVNLYDINLSDGIVLLNTDGKSLDMIGIVKTPTITTTPIETYFEFYIYSTRYGKK